MNMFLMLNVGRLRKKNIRGSPICQIEISYAVYSLRPARQTACAEYVTAITVIFVYSCMTGKLLLRLDFVSVDS